ncbi:MAG: AAA family ATPase [Methanomicrobia archaeon]|nr:AAA family ATPase [Methanomicrobia archaeon]
MESRIPPELREALSTGMGYALLIKGEPGTGKTMLAFEILNEFAGNNAVYLSTRVSIPALHAQFPWLEERTGAFNMVDATKLFISSRAFPRPRSFSEMLHKELVETQLEKPAILVLDSWEALTSEEKEEKIEALEASIIDAIRHYATEYKMNLILISERTEITPLDYIVDGIVELSRITVDYRRAREILLKKLRGVRISQYKYGFTLEGGRFRTFGPFERRKVEKPRKVEVVPSVDTFISTGVKELDLILGGGLSIGSTALVEYGDDLSLLGYQSIIAHMIINCIQQGTHVVKIPSSGWDERRLRRGILPFVEEQDYLKYLTVFEIRMQKREEARENVKILEGRTLSEEFPVFTEYIAQLEPPVMAIIGTDWLEYQYRLKALGNLEEALELFAYWIMEVRERGDIGVFSTPTGCLLGEGLGHMVSTKLDLAVLDRSVLLYCNRPDTKLHCLENIITEDALRLELTPFV